MSSVQRACLTSVCVAVLVSPAWGQEGWLGGKFMPKDGCVLKIGNREIPAANGDGLPFVPLQVSGEWLWTGSGWVQKSRIVPLEQAVSYYTEYLRSHPDSGWAYNLRGVVRDEQADFENALKDFTEAIRVEPQNANAYNNRGIVWRKQGESDAALKDFTEAIRLEPQNARAYNNRGVTWGSQGDVDNALNDFNEAIRLAPQDATAYDNLAWLLATWSEVQHRDGDRAVTMARNACELTEWEDASKLDTFAAACAESGDFEQAVRWQSKAMELLPSDAEYIDGARERLALYRDKKPYRQAPKN